MAMFPPKSPQTVRANGSASTIFAQQERAFLSNPLKLPKVPTLGPVVTEHPVSVASTNLGSAPPPTTALPLNGKCVVKTDMM